MSKQLRGQVYALCDSTLAQWAKSSLAAAVESRLQQDGIKSWTEGRARLMKAVAEEASNKNAERRHEDVKQAISVLVSIIEASQSPSWRHKEASSSEARIMSAAVGEVMYMHMPTITTRYAAPRWPTTAPRCTDLH